jgi:hypothetical protein
MRRGARRRCGWHNELRLARRFAAYGRELRAAHLRTRGESAGGSLADEPANRRLKPFPTRLAAYLTRCWAQSDHWFGVNWRGYTTNNLKQTTSEKFSKKSPIFGRLGYIQLHGAEGEAGVEALAPRCLQKFMKTRSQEPRHGVHFRNPNASVKMDRSTKVEWLTQHVQTEPAREWRPPRPVAAALACKCHTSRSCIEHRY